MKRIVLFLGLLLLAIPARAQYLDGLPPVSAVAPTDIIPICQGGTAGHAGTCTTRKATASQLQLGSLLNTNLNLGTGTLTAAGATFTGPLHMGANLIDGSNIAFTGGSFSGLSSLGVSGNATLSGTLTTGTGVTNGLLMSASTLSVTGTGNPAMVIRGLGTGGINFQSGATPFTGLQLTDGGASAVNLLRIQPGTTGNGVSLQVVGDAAATLNFKAGTGGTGGSAHFFVPATVGALSQHNNFVLAGVNPADLSTIGYLQTTNISGNNGASTSSNLSMNNITMVDTAVIKGSIGVLAASQSMQSPFDGDRNMLVFAMTKTAQSVTGDRIFQALFLSNHPTSSEGGNGDTITASQAGRTLTVTAAGGSVIGHGISTRTSTWIYGAGMVPERWISNGTGTGGTGTYTVDRDQDISSQTMSVANFAGSYELMNPDLYCDGGNDPYIKGCQGIELDLRLAAGGLYKNGIILNYGIFDAAHGVSSDCAFCTQSEGVPGSGGINIFAVGNGVGAWPIDSDRADSAMLAAYATTYKGVWSGYPARYRAGFAVNAEVVECLTACWRSPGFDVDGGGQLFAGPLTVAYSSTGTLLSAGRPAASASAVVTSGGGDYTAGDRVEGPDRSLWSVATISGSAVATLTMINPGYSAVCPSAAARFTQISPGSGLKATITCNTENGIVLGAASDKLGFYGATAIIKPTGWSAMTGTPDTGTVYDTSTVTLPQLAGRVASLQAALTAAGLIGP